MNKTALKHVIEVLKALSKEASFNMDMETWVEGDPDGRPGDALKSIPCGMAACAIGWCAVDPWFVRKGLRLRFVDAPWHPYGLAVEPTYRGKISYDALATFFGISLETVDYLFGWDEYEDMHDPAEVIAHIEQVLTHGEIT